uniref:Uncharacterized protein n=1 Tax=Cacopsylla melanoneura TaxID=428564 RepID=A0A8D9E1G6_9HEMI
MIDVCKKSRSDSCCTDSSTSGVSSCDSSQVPRYHHTHTTAYQTLSPIPSTGSIATMKSSKTQGPMESGATGATISKYRGSSSFKSKLHTGHYSTFLSLRTLRPHSPSPAVFPGPL